MKRILVYGMTSNRGGIEAYVMNYFNKINILILCFAKIIYAMQTKSKTAFDKMK